ncbi:hypothetical protein [Pseudomonas sichuanensis]|uniref:hypothetical protein n=1 Tax=Pseudomonas TaxID=286 RepID=UPI0036EDD410
MQQSYVLTIWNLFTMSGSDVCGAQAVIAIMDGDAEVDRLIIAGKVKNPGDYRRAYTGKSGLTAQVVSGPGELGFVWEASVGGRGQPVIAWRSHLSSPPSRAPVEVDVQDGHAEYVFGGPVRLVEGERIEVCEGKVFYSIRPAGG